MEAWEDFLAGVDFHSKNGYLIWKALKNENTYPSTY